MSYWIRKIGSRWAPLGPACAQLGPKLRRYGCSWTPSWRAPIGHVGLKLGPNRSRWIPSWSHVMHMKIQINSNMRQFGTSMSGYIYIIYMSVYISIYLHLYLYLCSCLCMALKIRMCRCRWWSPSRLRRRKSLTPATNTTITSGATWSLDACHSSRCSEATQRTSKNWTKNMSSVMG